MAMLTFEPRFFKVLELKKKINIANLFNKTTENAKMPVTFNQLMKSKDEFSYIFIFDEKSIEIPSLVSFCNYFHIKLFKLCSEDIKEMKNIINYSQMVCVPVKLSEEIENEIKGEENIKDISENLQKILNIA